jgi:serine/threonine protein phosphatase PrpC
MPSRPNHLFVAVFDGHGGGGAAIFAAKNLIDIIENTSQWKQYVEEGNENYQLLGEALQQAFLDLDKELRASQGRGTDTSGCTAVTAMITPQYIICANSGDSRCVLGYDGSQARALSEDHKPYDEPERRRIENAGGCVQWKRVDGDLAVSRAFGDFQYKTRPDLPAQEQKVRCDFLCTLTPPSSSLCR